jgi:6-pyruvoyltetrahydropterin/6-carboxytetrahydropterin synthase
MYTVEATFWVSAAHRLVLDYESACNNLHGHNWKITVQCKSAELNRNGMVLDFKTIKQSVHDVLDHAVINDKLPAGINPTAENMAKWICDLIGESCSMVKVQETEGNVAIYERD